MNNNHAYPKYFLTLAQIKNTVTLVLNFFVIVILLFVSLSLQAKEYMAGDLAPRGAPDGKINSADVVLLQRMIHGELIPTSSELNIADIAPFNIGDNVLNVADLAMLTRAVHGDVTLQPVIILPEPPGLDTLPATTNDNPLVITGTGTPNMTVYLYVNGVIQAVIPTNDDGSFGYEAALIDGVNNIYATTWDGEHESLPTPTYTVDYQNIIVRDFNNYSIPNNTKQYSLDTNLFTQLNTDTLCYNWNINGSC